MPGRETFICAECQRKAMREKKKDWNGAHTSIHSLVWLSPSSAARKKRTVEDRIESLDARLSKDMGEMSQRMEGLEAMVKDYYEIRVKKEVEQMMESYEARVHERIAALEGIVERRLANLEGLLARVLAGVAARDPARGD
ncbi:hypothetical protein FRC17_008059 [Serendipita sp. 399]|nr:hypothetical protein FRC17_008059 [Serendipita sp. 399]